MVTWGPDGAFFAMSEYGTVVYEFGDGDDEWEIYKETVEEWKAEKGFSWSNLAFIALDPTASDQFIAIRNDGTWAGSIDDVNEDALESFALNCLAKAKMRQNTKPQTDEQIPMEPSNSKFTDTKSVTATQALYEKWAKETVQALSSAQSALANLNLSPLPTTFSINSPSLSISTDTNSSTPTALLTSFPYLPPQTTTCALPHCIVTKSTPHDIKACKHDVEKLFRASGLYSYEWLRQERLRWHPDRFGRLCEDEWREVGRRMAEEMFKIIEGLMEELRGKGEEV